MITATVQIKGKAGETLFATATVSPTGKTPEDNTSTGKVIVRRG